MRDLERRVPLPASSLQVVQRCGKVLHPEHENRPLALDVIRKKHERRDRRQLHTGNPGSHGIHGEYGSTSQYACEEGEVCGDVAAWRIDEVELGEELFQRT